MGASSSLLESAGGGAVQVVPAGCSAPESFARAVPVPAVLGIAAADLQVLLGRLESTLWGAWRPRRCQQLAVRLGGPVLGPAAEFVLGSGCPADVRLQVAWWALAPARPLGVVGRLLGPLGESERARLRLLLARRLRFARAWRALDSAWRAAERTVGPAPACAVDVLAARARLEVARALLAGGAR